VSASLFGSRATGRAHPGSDVDIAVWLEPRLDAAHRLRLRLALERALARAHPDPPVDVVVLNDAPLVVRHRAARDGRRVLERDPRTRVQLETAALIAYLDTAALRNELARGQDARLAEGRFGRP
jgi:predicted nucleotidyltransferase